VRALRGLTREASGPGVKGFVRVFVKGEQWDCKGWRADTDASGTGRWGSSLIRIFIHIETIEGVRIEGMVRAKGEYARSWRGRSVRIAVLVSGCVDVWSLELC
jgi:hypothetical protein